MATEPIRIDSNLLSAALRRSPATSGHDEAELLRLSGDPLALGSFLNRITAPESVAASLPAVSLRRAASAEMMPAPPPAALFLSPRPEATSIRLERLDPTFEKAIDADDPLAGEAWPLCAAIGLALAVLLMLFAAGGMGLR